MSGDEEEEWHDPNEGATEEEIQEMHDNSKCDNEELGKDDDDDIHEYRIHDD